MLVPVKKGKVLLSHWVELNHRDWVKHRVGDYSQPMDFIKLVQSINMGTNNKLQYQWKIQFEGPNMGYIAYAYKQAYHYRDGETFPNEDLQKIKDRIDKFLTKIDKLVVFT